MGESDQKLLKEFGRFIAAQPKAPTRETDASILRMVERDLRPPLWKIYSKLILVQAIAGLLTLTICPQFGLGFNQHNEFLHALHLSTPPVVFYLLCGLFFVILGACAGGLVLRQEEIRTVDYGRYFYFAGYSALAYLILVTLGAEMFVASSLTWVLGAMLGNLLGFGAVARLRRPSLQRSCPKS